METENTTDDTPQTQLERLETELADVKTQLAELTIAFNNHVHVYRGDRNYKHLTRKPIDADDNSWIAGL